MKLKMLKKMNNITKAVGIILIVLITFRVTTIRKTPLSYTLEDYIVQKGDTAWTIASRNNTANKDIRELIYYMEQDNGIKAGNLNIGQEIKIRIYDNEHKKTDASAVTLTPEN